jgi:hypothetical protein
MAGGIEFETLILALICIPVVIFTTLLAKRFPPPLSAQQLRKGTFGLLVMVGLYLITSALMAILSFG